MADYVTSKDRLDAIMARARAIKLDAVLAMLMPLAVAVESERQQRAAALERIAPHVPDDLAPELAVLRRLS